MGAIKGWKLSKRSHSRFKHWISIKKNIVNVENPPSGWRTAISVEPHDDKLYKFKTKEAAIAKAMKYMRAHPKG